MTNVLSKKALMKDVLGKSLYNLIDGDVRFEDKDPPMPLNKILGYDFFPTQKAWAQWAVGDYQKIDRDENGRLKYPGTVKMILGARGYGKSEAVIFLGAIEALKKDPNLTFILSTRKHERGKEILETLSDIMKKMGFEGVFLKTKIRIRRPDGTMSKQPTFKLVPVGTTTKGNHCNILFLDDPLDPGDASSAAWKNKAMKFTQNCQDIADLSIIIGQYVNEDDLYVHYENTLPEKNIVRCWHGTIPELDVTWEEKRQQGYTLREWGLNYEGKFYPDDERRLVVETTNVMPYDTVCFIDMSFVRKSMTSTSGDFTAAAFGQLTGTPRKGKHGKILYPEVIIAGYMFPNINALKEKIMSLIDRHECRYIVYDASNDYDEQFVQWLSYAGYNGVCFPQKTEKEKKETKIIRNLTWIQDTGGIKYYRGSDVSFLEQVERYTPLEEHDDAPDAVASLVRELRNGRKYRQGVLQNATVWSDQFRH